MNIQQEFITTKEIVRQVLSEDQRARNDDLWLILQVWQKKQHINCFVQYDLLSTMISPETIRRVRQEIQNKNGELLPTDSKVLLKRRFREEAIKNYYGANSKEFSEYKEVLYEY